VETPSSSTLTPEVDEAGPHSSLRSTWDWANGKHTGEGGSRGGPTQDGQTSGSRARSRRETNRVKTRERKGKGCSKNGRNHNCRPRLKRNAGIEPADQKISVKWANPGSAVKKSSAGGWGNGPPDSPVSHGGRGCKIHWSCSHKPWQWKKKTNHRKTLRKPKQKIKGGGPGTTPRTGRGYSFVVTAPTITSSPSNNLRGPNSWHRGQVACCKKGKRENESTKLRCFFTTL